MTRFDHKTISRRGVLGGALGAAFLLACGDSDDGGTSSSSTPASSSSPSVAATRPRLFPGTPSELGAPAVPAATVATSSTAVPIGPITAPYANYGTTAAPGVFPRTIKHGMGETTLTKAPQKIVVLDTSERDAMVDLGIKPVGMVESSAIPVYLGDGVKGVQIVGPLAEPNLEMIAGLAPDLILSNKIRHEKLYANLSAIAPTVFGDRAGPVWRHNYELYAQAVGREVDAGKTIQKYEARVKAMNAKLPTPRPTVSIIRVLEKDLRYYQRANFIGILLTDLGFPRPASQNVDDFGLLNQSLETLGQSGDAGLVVLSSFGGPTNPFLKELQDSPIFKSLDAAKKGNVLVVDDGVWIGGLGYLAADAVMSDLAKYFKITA